MFLSRNLVNAARRLSNTRPVTTRTMLSLTSAGLGYYGFTVMSSSVVHADSNSASRKEELYTKTSEQAPFRIFAGSQTRDLAKEVASNLGMQLGRAKVGKFADGETRIQIFDNVRGHDTYIIASTSTNDALMELILMVSTLRRASANRVVAVIPYFGYVRQMSDDSSSPHSRVPIAGRTVAEMLETVGVDQVVAIEMHRPQVQGFFTKVPVEALTTTKSAIPYFVGKNLDSPVILTTSNTSMVRAKSFRNELQSKGVDASMAFMFAGDKNKGGRVQSVVDTDEQHHGELRNEIHIVGDVKGKDSIIVDDMIDTGSRVRKAVTALKARGANRVFAFATHGLFSGNAIEQLDRTEGLEEVVVFNTLPIHPDNWRPIVRQLSCSKLISTAIDIIHNQQSLQSLAAESDRVRIARRKEIE